MNHLGESRTRHGSALRGSSRLVEIPFQRRAGWRRDGLQRLPRIQHDPGTNGDLCGDQDVFDRSESENVSDYFEITR